MTIMSQPQGRPLPTRLRLDKGLQPCPVETGDEMYPNGIFEFNITRLLAFVQEHGDRFHVEQVDLSEFPDYGNSPHINESVIDGNHRLAKARRQGAAALPAYRLQCPTHVPFLTSVFAYEKYVEYWNDKVRTLLGDLRGQRKP
jgi:hypothetical protein